MTSYLPTYTVARRHWLGLVLSSVLALGLPIAHAQSPAATPIKGGTLTYAVFQEPTSLVSFLDTKTDNRNVSAKITEGLSVSYTHLTLPTNSLV